MCATLPVFFITCALIVRKCHMASVIGCRIFKTVLMTIIIVFTAAEQKQHVAMLTNVVLQYNKLK